MRFSAAVFLPLLVATFPLFAQERPAGRPTPAPSPRPTVAASVQNNAAAKSAAPKATARDEATAVPSWANSNLAPTPEMWFYDQERNRNMDPKEIRRRRIEYRVAQRDYRLAALKAHGLSNSRPIASPTPLFGTYAPMWVSNSFDPSRWRQPKSTYYVLRPQVIR